MIKLFENYKEIAAICEKYAIRNWNLNPDGSIDVHGDVILYYRNLNKIPLKFNRVTGYFNCGNNNLITLEGAPREVGGYFYCSHNKLTTLVGAPSRVGGYFECNNNKLTTLEGSPREVGGSFDCNNNKLITLNGAPREVGGDFYYQDNNLPVYFTKFIELNNYSQPIIKQILKWQDEYELWKDPKNFEKKFKWMMEDIQENDLPDIKIKFPR